MSAPSPTTITAAALERAVSRTGEFGEALARDFSGLSRRDVLTILRALKRKLTPPGKRGRRRSKQITTAHADWKAGMHGVALYARHVPGFRTMSYWKKKDKIRGLMDAIRKRERGADKSKSCPAE